MHQRSQLLSQERGFTFVELVVVVAIAAILIGVGYTGFSGTLERQRCQAALKRVAWLLKQAQMQAIEKHTSCAVVANSSTDTIQAFLDQNDDSALGANDTLLESINVGQEYQGVEIKQDASLRFGSRGLPASYGTIRVGSTDSSWEDGNVTVSSVGRINVEMPEGWNY